MALLIEWGYFCNPLPQIYLISGSIFSPQPTEGSGVWTNADEDMRCMRMPLMHFTAQAISSSFLHLCWIKHLFSGTFQVLAV